LEGFTDLPLKTQGSDTKHMSSREYVKDLKEKKMAKQHKESLKRLKFID